MTDVDDWEDYDSGPFCRHWGDPWDCDATCSACGHSCARHGYGFESGCEDCDCADWTEAQKPPAPPKPPETIACACGTTHTPPDCAIFFCVCRRSYMPDIFGKWYEVDTDQRRPGPVAISFSLRSSLLPTVAQEVDTGRDPHQRDGT